MTPAKFLTDFKALYLQINIRPKFHFPVHFSSIVRKNGAMKNFWVINFERLNGAMKVPTRIMNCFKNPAYTMENRRQCSVLHLSATTNFQSYLIEYSPAIEMALDLSTFKKNDNITFLEMIINEEGILVSDHVKICGTEYRNEMFIIIGRDERDLIFGKIKYIVTNYPQHPLFVILVHTTMIFDSHCHCYEVQRKIPTHFQLLQLRNFVDFHPLDGINKGGKIFIRLKYHIAK